MRIAIIGTPKQKEELKRRISSEHQLIEIKNNEFDGFDLIFDLSFDKDNSRLETYRSLEGIPIVVGAVKKQLEESLSTENEGIPPRFYGINNLPTFIDRDLAEMTSLNEESRTSIEEIFEQLNWNVKWVKSRVGMVTPRVVCMIINEAYYTVQEGTATKEDIDIGMKLGTAYPKGPFEWVEEIGVREVYEFLEAVYNDTKDERYKICPMLKTEYLKNK